MKKTLPVIRDGLYRTPMHAERDLGLWVDRAGEAIDVGPLSRLRVLGLYAALSVGEGGGVFYSPATGEVPVSAGDAMVVFPHVPSMYYPHTHWRTQWIVWGGPEAERLESMGCLRPDRPVLSGMGGMVAEAYAALSPLMVREDLGAMLSRKAVLLELVGALCASDAAERPLEDAHQRMVAHAVEHIRQTLSHPPSVEELAEEAGVHPTHFRRVFCRVTGRNPKDAILSLRLAEAKACLLAGMSIKETAHQLGFQDVFYFMRMFRKVVGTTARRYADGAHGA